MSQIEIITVLRDAKEPLSLRQLEKLTGISYNSLSISIKKIQNIKIEKRVVNKRTVQFYTFKS